MTLHRLASGTMVLVDDDGLAHFTPDAHPDLDVDVDVDFGAERDDWEDWVDRTI